MEETEQPEKFEEKIKLYPIVRQLIQHKFAHFCTETEGSDLYHLMEAIELLRVALEPTEKKNILQEHFGHRYSKVVKNLKRLNHRLTKVKRYYDSKGSFDENTKLKKINEEFQDEFSKVPLISRTMFEVFIVLIEQTELQFLSIPNEYFKRMDKKDKTVSPTNLREKDSFKKTS